MGLLRILAVTLDVPEDAVNSEMSRQCRILSSRPHPPHSAPPSPGQLRTGAHTDFGAMTILAMTDADGCLEVRMPDRKWLAVRPAPGTLVVNLGDMMARWTNDRWTSTLHRVANPKNLSSARSRRQTLGAGT